MHAVEFVEHLAEMAEDDNHHPDIDIRYNKVTLAPEHAQRRRPHRSDVELAAGIDGVASAAQSRL